MRSGFATLEFLGAPAGAGPDDPAVTMGAGNAIPPEVTAYYAALTGAPNKGAVIGIIRMRRDSQHYDFLATVVPTDVLSEPYVSMGTCRFGVVSQAQRWSGISGGSAVDLISQAGTLSKTWTWRAQALGDTISALDWDATNGVHPAVAVEMPRGRRAFAANTAADAVTTAITTFLSLGAVTFRAGRAYRFSTGGTVLMSASTNVVELRIADNPLTFQAYLGAYGPSGSTRRVAAHGAVILTNPTANDVTRTLGGCANTDVGTGTWDGSISGKFVEVDDVGAAADFPGTFTV